MVKSLKLLNTSWVGYDTYINAELIEYNATKYNPPSITCSLIGSFEDSFLNICLIVPTRKQDSAGKNVVAEEYTNLDVVPSVLV